MTLYRVNIGTKEYMVDVSDQQVSVNGVPMEADLVSLNEGGLYMLRGSSKAREMHLRALGQKAYAILVNGKHVIAQVEKATGRNRRTAAQANAGDLRAPMPGVVIEIPVQEGQQVEAGDTLVVLESMKMQMRLRAPIAGRVVKLLATSRAQVEKGALLVQVVQD
jgi:biotin carboxyl carrier protein